MATQKTDVQEPDSQTALWLDYEFATFKRGEDFSHLNCGGVYIFADLLGQEWTVRANGRLAFEEPPPSGGKPLVNPYVRRYPNHSSITLASRTTEQLGLTQDNEELLWWWPLYVAQTSNLAEDLPPNQNRHDDPCGQ